MRNPSKTWTVALVVFYVALAPFVLWIAAVLTMHMAQTGDGYLYSGHVTRNDGWIMLAVVTFSYLLSRARFPHDKFFT